MTTFEDESLPDELEDVCTNFHVALGKVEEKLQPLLAIPREALQEHLDDPLHRVSIDLVVAYAVNSLFWTYLQTSGVPTAGHPIKKELDRIKTCMNRVKETKNAPRRSVVLNKDASKRVIRGAMWTPNKEKDETAAVKRKAETIAGEPSQKRPAI